MRNSGLAQVLLRRAWFYESTTEHRGKESRQERSLRPPGSPPPSPAEIRDEVERTRERRSRDTLAQMPLADEVARRPPVRQCRHALLIRGPVLDPRHLVGRAELAPAQAVVPIEHEGCMRRPCPHASQLPLA